MAERSPRDDPENMKNSEKGFLDYDVTDICFESIPGDLFLQEESTKINLGLCDDGAAQEPQVKGSASASSSAINEANKNTDASSSSSSSRNRETGEIRRFDKENDRNDGDDGDKPKESDNESDLKERDRENDRYYDRFLGLSDHGSTSSTSDRTNISQTIGMQSQISPRAAPWGLQNTYQQHPVANQMANLVPTQTMMPRPTQIPPMSHDQMMYPYQDPEAYQRYPYPHPMANQMYPYQHPEAYQRYPYQRPMANQMYPYQHPEADQMYMYPYQHPLPNQHNFYRHPVDSQQNVYHYPMFDPRMPQFRNIARGQPRSFGRGQNYFHPRQARPQLNQQMLQRVPQTQQPKQSQGFNARPSSEQGQDQ